MRLATRDLVFPLSAAIAMATSGALAQTTSGAAGPADRPRAAQATVEEVIVTFIETAFRDTVTCRLEGDRLLIDRRVNVNNGPLSLPTFHAAAA